jgi:hypothetical protein
MYIAEAIENLNGSINVTSELAETTVTIPESRILIIDDNLIDQIVTKQLLKTVAFTSNWSIQEKKHFSGWGKNLTDLVLDIKCQKWMDLSFRRI